ncbi:YihY/virulence factor BrkB family protein [Histidinibacterium aquaticum]|uniref:YihY/virulence factor BrkB family protein n=1 Tax=Histidinibacterium aquaticum TaxID=2613962 RepID=A0A5J5GQU4_9RHOB|nr:YihY/virulence factor BrkB family protein [Histidinibacterium aquaticum]KAA9010417.1 YihY/virulence factor BrkB family protein [Histidinibacterium aquaticum]
MTDRPGETAPTPRGLPRAAWMEIGKRVWADIGRDHVALIAAGIAFFGLLALFPAITALMAIAGLVLEPSQVTEQLDRISAFVPQGASEIILGQAQEVAGSDQAGLGLAAVVGLGLALYSASKGVSSLMEGLCVAYDEQDERGFVKRTALTLVLTVVLVIGIVAGLAATILVPSLLSLLTLGPVTEFLVAAARWVVLLAMTVVGIGILYRYGPDRDAPQWRWLTPGAVLATILWIAASAGFAIYAENFASYQESFGAMAGMIVLLMWLWISAYAILVGAEINAEAERQTAQDSTVGEARPAGSRGATAADHAPKTD